MSEEVTDADRQWANAWSGNISNTKELARSFAAHRIAAAKAERERLSKLLRERAELCSDEGYYEMNKIADELAKEE